MSAPSQSLLTIGIPTYNSGADLPELFESINKLALHNTDYEILVIDNHSDDETDEVILELKKQFATLRYYKNDKNVGRVQNWNRVLELTQGKYLILMSVYDRFMNFETSSLIHYMDENPEIPMILTDIHFEDHNYPNWQEHGLLHIHDYLRKTFLEPEYLEFHSVGLLQQHIFRTETIKANHLKFDSQIPRTTDRVFAGQVVSAGGGYFYYINKPMVSWHLNSNRYHNSVHNNKQKFNFHELWINEYEANVQLAELGKISFADVIYSQLILASFFTHIKHLRYLKDKVLRKRTPTKGLEIYTANVFYCYLKAMAQLNNIPVNYTAVKVTALWRAVSLYLRSISLNKKNQRSLKGIIKQTELV